MKTKGKILTLSLLALSALFVIGCDGSNGVEAGNTSGDTTGGNNTGDTTGGNNTGDTTGGNNTGDTTGGNNTGDTTGGNTSGDTTGGTIVNPASGSVEILQSVGAAEAGYVTLNKVDCADDYAIYYKGSTDSTYIKISKSLIREYSDYYRADIPGLKEGSYDIKVLPIINGVEQAEVALSSFTVKAHDRSGFAFSNNADASGAYKADGTLKANAQVIYVTAKNAKTVSASINGTTVNGLQAIITALGKKNVTDILDIRIIGELKTSDVDTLGSSAEGLQVKGGSAYQNLNLTIEGIGTDATINGFGILLRNCSNVEIRNLGVINFMDDGFSVDTDCKNLWLHNNDFFYGNPGGDSDQAKGDGSLDIKKSQYITVSYNHFWDSGKCCLVDASASTEEGHADFLTYHHNWFDHSDSRHARVRNASAIHMYNNYYDGNSKYGIGASVGSSIFSEANYFRNAKYPMLTSLQGNDKATSDSPKGTFSGENGGFIKSYGNSINGGSYSPYSTTNTVEFDAYEASTRLEVIPSTVTAKVGGQAYSNFDTATTMYTYTADNASDVPTIVKGNAGRISGGDLQYTFDNSVDDTSYDINSALKALVSGYKTSLIRILSEEASTDTPIEDLATAEAVITLITALPEASAVVKADASSINAALAAYNALTEAEKAKVTNYQKLVNCNNALASLPQTVEYLTFNTGATGDNSLFIVSGSLKSGIASKLYDGVSYTTALKMEGTTSIVYTATSVSTVTIVTDTPSKGIKINGTKYKTDADGIVVATNIPAGAITITKGDPMNVYVIIIE